REYTDENDLADRRFQREVELVANLRHPGIVRLFDSGRTAEGRSYLVMEFVEGLSLDDWAVSVKRDAPTIAAMLARIADAVQHAHQRGVIHRDLKPSNIRVDAEGQPRVLDFGLAKVLTPDAREIGSGMTISRAGQFMGSLPFAAPEQVAPSASSSTTGPLQAVDTRTDVYAVGVMLYYTLSGRLPCDVSGDVASAIAAITTATPTPLHKLVAGLPEPNEAVAAIALAKVPDERYASAADFAADLRNVLAGEPIMAQRQTAWRTARRRLRRYRIALSLGLIALLAVGGLAAFAWVQRNLAERERAAAELARAAEAEQRASAEKALDIARTRTRQQDAFNAFLTSILAAPQPGMMGRDVKMVDVLRRAGGDVPVKFANDPLTAAKMYGVLAASFRQLGIMDEAVKYMDLALDSARKTGREVTIADTEFNKGQLLNQVMGDGKSSEPLIRSAMEVRLRRAGPDSEDVRQCYGELGTSLQLQGRLDEALEWFAKVVQSAERITPQAERDRAMIVAANNLAGAQMSAGRFEEALGNYQRAFDLATALLTPEHPNTLVARLNRARALVRLNRTPEAISELRATLAIQQRVLGADHPQVGATWNHLAGALSAVAEAAGATGAGERSAESVEAARQAVSIARAKLGPEARNTLAFAATLATSLRRAGSLAESLVQADEALAVSARVFGPTHPQTLAIRVVRAETLLAQGERRAAITGLLGDDAGTPDSYAAATAARGPGDPDALAMASILSRAFRALGDEAAASTWSTRAQPPARP
nr:serine/threonine-protein kinase [Phycisphaerales bacterium]